MATGAEPCALPVYWSCGHHFRFGEPHQSIRISTARPYLPLSIEQLLDEPDQRVSGAKFPRHPATMFRAVGAGENRGFCLENARASACRTIGSTVRYC